MIAVRSTGISEPVYDLTVAEDHEFFANGLLVHNCTWQPTDPLSPGRIDASVYLAYGLLPVPSAGRADASGAAALAAVDLTRQLRPGDMGR